MSLLDPIKWNYLALGRQIETFSLVFLKLMLIRLCTDPFLMSARLVSESEQGTNRLVSSAYLRKIFIANSTQKSLSITT